MMAWSVRPNTAPPAEQIARWEKLRAGGRTEFIFRRGIIGWAVPFGFLTLAYKVIQEQGFVTSPVLTEALRTAILVVAVVFPFCGWLFGRWLWTSGEENYKTLLERRDRRE